MTLAAGARLGPYEITGPLGAGGMGVVYRARDTRLGRSVAIKVLPPDFAQDAERLRRFEQEARATSALNHPHIVAIFDVGSEQGAPYVVSELLEGATLRDRLAGGALPARKAIEYAVQVAHGLAAAHAKGIVHRDLKPENVFVTKEARVKILDFGLAKLVRPQSSGSGETATGDLGTEPGVVMGTVGYMSPEQVRGQVVDHRSDIFSFGAILYEMLSGRRAFSGTTAVETMNAILKEDPPGLLEANRTLSPGLDRIVSHCLEKNPEERFDSARDLAFDLAARRSFRALRPRLRRRRRRGGGGWRALCSSLWRSLQASCWTGWPASPRRPSRRPIAASRSGAGRSTPRGSRPMGRPWCTARRGKVGRPRSTRAGSAAPSGGLWG